MSYFDPLYDPSYSPYFSEYPYSLNHSIDWTKNISKNYPSLYKEVSPAKGENDKTKKQDRNYSINFGKNRKGSHAPVQFHSLDFSDLIFDNIGYHAIGTDLDYYA